MPIEPVLRVEVAGTSRYTLLITLKDLDTAGRLRTSQDKKPPELSMRSGGFRSLLKLSKHQSGGDGGIRTHDTGISRMHP